MNSLPSTSSDRKSSQLLTWCLFALWAGVLAGLLEGVGLLAFQRINWARWGPMVHVSAPILWISPIVDVGLYVVVAWAAWLTTRVFCRNPSIRMLAFLLAYLTIYDWLTLTNRLDRLACILLAAGVAMVSSRLVAPRSERVAKFIFRSLPAVLGIFAITFLGEHGSRWWKERSATAALPPATSSVPNVLVIVVDTLRADHVSAYGYSRPTTPNIDQLAKEGVLFENAVAPSSWSLPSHVSLVTGRYLHDHKVGTVQGEPWLGWGRSGLGGLPTIGEELQKQGYRTGAFSANRTYFSKDLGFGRGFIHFEDYFHSPADGFVRTLYGREFARIYLKRSNKSLIKRLLRRLGWNSLLDQDAEGSGSYGGAFGIRKHANAVNDEFLRWVTQDTKRPFFAFLNYFDVHDPYGGPSEFRNGSWAQDTDVDRYDNGIRYVDDCLGHLMDSLRQRRLSEQTIVIVTSDHGESLGQHYLMTHGRALYWELIHVPLVVWYPRQIHAGERVRDPVSIATIPATIIEILGVNPGSFLGPALPMSFGMPRGKPLGIAVSELAQNIYPGKHDQAADKFIPTATTGSMQSLTTAEWHLISHSESGSQLYKWTVDPGETEDLAKTPSGVATANKLAEQLQELTPR